MRYTISPLASRAVLPELYRRIFAPRPVPTRFQQRFPSSLALRPWQIRAAAEETAMMIPAAAAMQESYRDLRGPTTIIIAGAEDEIVTTSEQSERLHRDVPDSDLVILPGLGHMLHYDAADRITQAVDKLARG
jgi:pimeloyl-ACP methyl ester carboxylesterase